MLADRDVLFLHRLQQRRLGLGRGAVDLVSQDEVGENRTVHKPETAASGIGIDFQHIGAGDVRWHEVGRELNALVAQFQRARQGRYQQGFRQTGHADKQRMAATKDRHQHLFHHLVLADDDPAEFIFHLTIDLMQFIYRGFIIIAHSGLTTAKGKHSFQKYFSLTCIYHPHCEIGEVRPQRLARSNHAADLTTEQLSADG